MGKTTKYVFTHAVTIKGQVFKRGVNDVSEEVENHPHFLKFVGVGFIHEPEAAVEKPAYISPSERSKMLLEKVMSRKNVAPAKTGSASVANEASAVSEAPKSEEPEDFLDAPQGEEDFIEPPKKGKKK